MKILVTGGAGYIGSTTSHFLVENGHDVAILDNLSNGHKKAIPKKAVFYNADLLEPNQIDSVFQKEKPDAVIHFAGLIQVGESVQEPLKYYQTNVSGTINLLLAMKKDSCKKIVFSSSAAVYGNPAIVPILETSALAPVNPYGHTKLLAEQIFEQCRGAFGLEFVNLRYFNACGAAFGVGENHRPETHLIPLVLRAAQKKFGLSVFGNDYDTPDGSCIRDYVHVFDLADAHAKAIDYLNQQKPSGAFNLGSGDGYSVLEIIRTAEQITEKKIEYQIKPRRDGDPARLVATNAKAKKELGWKPTKSLTEIMSSAWNWETNRPSE